MSMVINKDYSISTALFTWAPELKAFVTEISTLRRYNTMQRLYDGAADVGFVLESEKTGALEVFYLASELVVDSEIIRWNFRPLNPTLADRGLKVFIYND